VASWNAVEREKRSGRTKYEGEGGMAISKYSGNNEVLKKVSKGSERCLRAFMTVIGVHH
jgi:hypothetical protein